MKILFIMDHISKLNKDTDSTLLLIDSWQKKGNIVSTCQPENIFFDSEPKVFLDKEKIELNNFDFIFIRQDPPFDSAYLTCTYLLEMLDKKVKMVNNPRSLRDFTEKLSSLYFVEYMPKTIVTRELALIEEFVKLNKRAVIKPLYSAAGKGVQEIDLSSWQEKSSKLIETYNDAIEVQEFLPAIENGDKRVFISCGKILGYYRRVPQNGRILANQAQGGRIEATDLTAQEKEIATKVGQFLLNKKIYIVGIDLIDEKLTEINVTSPTGLRAINNIFNIKSEDVIVEDIINTLC